MFKFSSISEKNLESCHPDIQRVFNEVIKHVDCTIISGLRTDFEQAELVRTGKSKTFLSKHLRQNDGFSHAVDVMPYPISWTYDIDSVMRNSMFIGFSLATAKQLGIPLINGADWDGDWNVAEHSFWDLAHYQLPDSYRQ